MSKHVGKRGKKQRRQIAHTSESVFADIPRGPDRNDVFTIKSNRGSRGKNGGFYEKRALFFDAKGKAFNGLFCVNPKRATNPATPGGRA